MSKVLIVDDDQMMISLISFRLKKEGFEVSSAENGLEAIELLEKTAPDIIVSDILMPIMSGLEFVDHIRNQMKLQIPIIMISTSGHEKTVLEAFDLGANDFITKPFSPSELVVRLRKYFN